MLVFKDGNNRLVLKIGRELNMMALTLKLETGLL